MSTPDNLVAVVIDTGNVYHALKSAKRGKLDYDKYLQVITERFGQIDTAFAYVDSYSDNVQSFIAKLEYSGFSTITKSPVQVDGHFVTDWSQEIIQLLNSLPHSMIVVSSNDKRLEETLISLKGRVFVYACGVNKAYRHAGIPYMNMQEDVLWK